MFADNVEIEVKAGKGGDGRTSFRHEKYRAKGGPDGGDGGNGGDIVLEVDHNLNTLAYFRNHRQIKAESGQMGGKNRSHGKTAEDVIIKVPVGTMVFDGQAKQFDLTEDGQRQVIAKGGQGGFGNAHFASSTRQTPRAAELGEPGEVKRLRLELKLVADVGLVGLPNAGKSTLLSVISNAHPEIADYAFTTLVPNLGVVAIDDYSFVVADIPGLIEGASQGKGLGDEFLRHIERTAVVIHLIDCHSNDIERDFSTIKKELKAYSPELAAKPTIIALTKIETCRPATLKRQASQLQKLTQESILTISAQAHQGISQLLRSAVKSIKAARQQLDDEAASQEFVFDLSNVPAAMPKFKIEKTSGGWQVAGERIERFARRTDFGNPDALDRLRDILGKTGIIKKLEREGLQQGDQIEIGGQTLTW
jgi:GTP-binding protein